MFISHTIFEDLNPKKSMLKKELMTFISSFFYSVGVYYI